MYIPEYLLARIQVRLAELERGLRSDYPVFELYLRTKSKHGRRQIECAAVA